MKTSGELLEKAKKDREKMEKRFPGVKFSLAQKNPMGVRAGKKLGVPGVDKPWAIMDFKAPFSTIDTVKKVISVFEKQSKQANASYLSFTSCAAEMDYDFFALFGALNWLKSMDPYSVNYTINRSGDCHAFSINLKNAKKLID